MHALIYAALITMLVSRRIETELILKEAKDPDLNRDTLTQILMDS